VTLGGRRVAVTRPRVRAADGSGELPVASYQLFTSTEILGKMAVEKMLAGLSGRRYPVGLEPVGEQIAEMSSATSPRSPAASSSARALGEIPYVQCEVPPPECRHPCYAPLPAHGEADQFGHQIGCRQQNFQPCRVRNGCSGWSRGVTGAAASRIDGSRRTASQLSALEGRQLLARHVDDERREHVRSFPRWADAQSWRIDVRFSRSPHGSPWWFPSGAPDCAAIARTAHPQIPNRPLTPRRCQSPVPR
jgi:hypothetical protein